MQVIDSTANSRQQRDTGIQPNGQPPKLLARVRADMRVRHYSLSTERTYLHWIRRFVHWSGLRHPADMGAAEVQAFLSHLATTDDVSASTQNQAMHALLYLYRNVLGVSLPWLDQVTRARESKRLPVVLTQRETIALLRHVHGTAGTVIKLLYGTGMRLMEALRLRVQDIDTERRQITIRQGKGDKDRMTMLPVTMVDERCR